jgi:hypothetical protein
MAPQQSFKDRPPSYAEATDKPHDQRGPSIVPCSPEAGPDPKESNVTNIEQMGQEPSTFVGAVPVAINDHLDYRHPSYHEAAAQDSGLTNALLFKMNSTSLDSQAPAGAIPQTANEKRSKRYRRLHRAEEVASSLFATAVLAAVFIGFV